MFSNSFQNSPRQIWISVLLPMALVSFLTCSQARPPVRSAWWERGPSASPRLLKFQRSFGSPGSGPGQFLDPHGISVDPEGNIYVADTGNHRVQKFDSRGRFIEEIGGFGWQGAQFNRPMGLTAREGLNIYVVDSQNRRVLRFDRSLNYLSAMPSYSEEEEQLRPGFLWGVEVASTGEIFLSDVENEQVLKLTSFGEVERFFGGFESGPMRLRAPAGLSVAPGNAVCVADAANDRVVVYDAFGGFLGSLGEGLLQGPRGLEVDHHGYLYVADTGHHRVCVFDHQGELLLSQGTLGDGFGFFRSPMDLAISNMGWMCVLDSGNGRIQLFEIVR